MDAIDFGRFAKNNMAAIELFKINAIYMLLYSPCERDLKNRFTNRLQI